MPGNAVLLIHPPVTKPSEPPAGIARLAGALRSHGIGCTAIDANIEGLYHLLGHIRKPADTWSRRARRHLDAHLGALRNHETYAQPDKYRRAVADINRLLSQAGTDDGVRVSLANFEDQRHSPLRSADLLLAAQHPEHNPYYSYYQNQILPVAEALKPRVIGISIGFLSQALCAFALIGLLRKACPEAHIIIGGGLITSWLQRPGWTHPFSRWVDRMVAGPGEAALIHAAGRDIRTETYLPDYDDLVGHPYLSPGFVLPFSASDGCWWRRCDFCPEQAEKNPYRPLPHTAALEQIRHLVRHTRPAMVHLLDNAVSPALLRRLAADAPDSPWYGFVRIAPPLNDPDFCRRLARSGCSMLKIGLESGDQKVLDALHKGIRLDMASKVLRNLHAAGITAYVYLLFGTPADDEAAAEKTLQYVVAHHRYIGFLNLAIFNLPLGGFDSETLALRPFYAGDLALYSDFHHPQGWHRSAVRQFVEKRFKKHPAIQPIVRRDPPIFTSNHAAFFTSPG